MKRLRALNEAELGPILDFIHDQRYDIDRLSLDRASGELRIPIYLGSRQCEGTLFIRGASSYELKDEAQIGEGDINTIRKKGPRIEINGAFPVKIFIETDRFDIELTLPDDAPVA